MRLALIKRIDFQFANLMHSALVSISGSSEAMFVHVQLVNSFMKKVLGFEHIRFLNNKGEIKIDGGIQQLAYQVAQIITHKLNEELHKEMADLKPV